MAVSVTPQKEGERRTTMRQLLATSFPAPDRQSEQCHTRPSASSRGLDHLTRRESAIFCELVEKRTNSEIAHRLGISPETVKTHVSHILAKLGARSRSELPTLIS